MPKETAPHKPHKLGSIEKNLNFLYNFIKFATGSEVPVIRVVLIFFVVLLFIGGYWTFADPWAFAKIPGDVYVLFEGLRIYVPFGTSLILTGVISIVVYLFETGRK